MGRRIILALTLSISAAYAQQAAAPQSKKEYLVQGMVNHPGAYSLARPTTVLEGLVQAGGFRDFANQRDIVVLRGEKRIPFNYQDVIRGKAREQNVLLEAGDLIVVKER